MKLVHKMIDFERLEASQKNYDEVYLVKLQVYIAQTATLL